MRQNEIAFSCLVAGVGLFVTVPVQEYFEAGMQAAGGTDWKRPAVYVVLEEGAELLGMLCFLAGMCIYGWELARPRKLLKSIRTIKVVISSALALASYLVVVIVSGIGIYVAPLVLQPSRLSGTPENWFPCAVAFLASLVSLQRAQQTSSPGVRRAYIWLGADCLFTSAYVGGNFPAKGDQLWIARLAGLVLTLCACIMLIKAVRRWQESAAFLAWAVLVSLVMLTANGAIAQASLIAAVATLFPSLCLGFDSKVRVGTV